MVNRKLAESTAASTSGVCVESGSPCSVTRAGYTTSFTNLVRSVSNEYLGEHHDPFLVFYIFYCVRNI